MISSGLAIMVVAIWLEKQWPNVALYYIGAVLFLIGLPSTRELVERAIAMSKEPSTKWPS